MRDCELPVIITSSTYTNKMMNGVNLFITMVSKPLNKSKVLSSNLVEAPTPTKGESSIHQAAKCQPLKEGHLLRNFGSLYEQVNLFITMVSQPFNKSNVLSSNLIEAPTPTKGESRIHQAAKCQPLKEGHLLRSFGSLYEQVNLFVTMVSEPSN
ncbi:hypothetical protein V8G54_004035 [Vigna mungo]|uniref:Uncharacterized protein n=1 Tax=Vigna mungo TaxID=3915 RepID=A0AAQ3PCT4_VIGMU